MKTLTTILSILTLVISVPSWAAHDAETADACENTVSVSVNGLVCDFCARALEKVFSKRDEVTGIHVDLDNGLVKVHFKEGASIDDETLTKLITDSGYNVTTIKEGC